MTNIAALYARDPHEHSDEDFRQIIESLRADRAKFILGGGKAPAKEPKVAKEVAGLNLDIKL